MNWNDHDHRGDYAETSHTHSFWDLNDVAEKHHRHYDDESTVRGLREDLRAAEARIRELEEDQDATRRQLDLVLAQIRVLDRLRPTCVICHDATADRQTTQGPACTDCVGDLPDDGPDPDRPETWAFGEAPVQPLRPDEAGGYVCPETSDGQHCGDWHEGGKCGACGQTGPDPDEDQADEPEPAPYDPGPEVDDKGGMSEYRYTLPEDYQRGQS
jgi:hypothetical protein